MEIAGLDSSINSTGKCIMTLDDVNYNIVDIKLYAYSKIKKICFTSRKCEVFHVGTKYPSLNMFDRQNIAYEYLNKDMKNVKYVAFEGYAYDEKKSRSVFQLAEFTGGIKKMFYDQGKGTIIYAPRMVKRFATGNGNAGKTLMCESFKEEFPHLYPTKYFANLPQFENPHCDICDAFWIAETLRNHLIYDKLGPEKMDEGTVAFLEHKTNKKTQSIIETKLLKKPK